MKNPYHAKDRIVITQNGVRYCAEVTGVDDDGIVITMMDYVPIPPETITPDQVALDKDYYWLVDQDFDLGPIR